ncbi:MAG: hypothetical protein MZV63_24825 [Marinilabiliales bacterium]|nr:hypothetical protein [Marinilabiliales bacterium]
MEDNGLGNIIFYIILAIIGLAGSFQNKKKKVPGQAAPRKASPPPVQQQPGVEVPRRPQPVFAEPVDEGHYAEPMARQSFCRGIDRKLYGCCICLLKGSEG